MHILAEFWRGADDASRLPKSSLPEIAMIGRSNVGKSTLINRICNQRNLARASNTPGRTQEINLFKVTLKEKPKKDRQIVLADLPGFGFAKASRSDRENFQALVLEYVQSRENLKLICLLNDVRRKPEAEELGIRSIAYEHGVPALVVVTKVDKYSNNERRKAISAICKGYGIEESDLIISGDKISAQDILKKILAMAKHS